MLVAVRYLAGLLVLLAGLGVIWVSYHADELGLGQYEGVGENHFLVTLLGVCVCGGGLLLLLAPRRKHRTQNVGPRSSARPRSGYRR